ncbi:MAG: alpha-L-arabinofuranosidase C-terminal domain-containing protein [Bacteroidota bacterium]|nr:alpha-L-arabinofuranosidase C-terminal domain-containing protein [Bacteroidota bacterium]
MIYKLLLIFVFLFSSFVYGQQVITTVDNQLSIDFSKKESRISPFRYGIFLEEINHGIDGGLYAELIRNRGFEDKSIAPGCTIEKGFLIPPQKPNYLTGRISNWKMPWDTLDKWPGWSLKMKGLSAATMKLVSSNPLNEATPHSMQIDITKADIKFPVFLVNEGYWGIPAIKGETYDLKFFLRGSSKFKGKVTAQLITRRGKVLGSEDIQVKSDSLWNEYNVTLKALKSDNRARLALKFTSLGRFLVDYVSLFPEKTYKNRANGLRRDVVQLLAGLKPAFIRWPGGCTVEGLTLEDRVKWKETLGNPVSRLGVFDLWGYRNSYGMGYHEFLQLCEDLGSSALFVCNAGLASPNRNGDFCTEDEVPSFIQEALDAIEYALGDSTTTWGAKRIAAGHKVPFPLKYIEIGNESSGPVYAQRYALFLKAIKDRFPQITVISSSITSERNGMIDLRYYRSPHWFYRNTGLFDSMSFLSGYNICIGGFAANQGVGTANWNTALSEAAFMTGIERNADKVSLYSYAPLIANAADCSWPVNMICLKNNGAFAGSSYYVQKLFTENRPDINLHTQLQMSGLDIPKQVFAGLTGLGTSSANVVFKDFSVTQSGNNYISDYFNRQEDWEPYYGHWRVENGEYIQGDLGTRRVSLLHDKAFGNVSIEVKARKIKGEEGFMILFGGVDKDEYYQLNVGANGNHKLVIERVMGGVSIAVSDSVSFSIENNCWYDVRVMVNNDEAECFIDGQSLLKYKIKEPSMRYAVAGFDTTKNEIVVKVVNAGPVVFKTKVNLLGAGSVETKGKVITMSASSAKDENSFKEPTKIIPIEKDWTGFSDRFNFEFKPYSLTVLRIKRK